LNKTNGNYMICISTFKIDSSNLSLYPHFLGGKHNTTTVGGEEFSVEKLTIKSKVEIGPLS